MHYEGWSFSARSAAISHIALYLCEYYEHISIWWKGILTLIASALSFLVSPRAILSLMFSIITERDLPLTKTL